MLGLASGSPRRRALLDQIGVAHLWRATRVDESARPGESPSALARRLAATKAQAGRALFDDPRLPVLGADTLVVVDGEILGKPRDMVEAAAMLRRLSGRTHRVYSAVALQGASGLRVALSLSRVCMRRLPRWEIAAYCASGEPLGKAGGYAIQGGAAVFVREIIGSYSGVMGLPLYETARLLRAAGIIAPFPAARA